MLFICSRSLRCVSDKAAMSWQWGFLCLGTERPMVVSAVEIVAAIISPSVLGLHGLVISN